MLFLLIALTIGFQSTYGLNQGVINTLVARHNACRATDGVGPVKWDENLARFAQRWAESLGGCSLRHSTNRARKNIAGWSGKQAGENLAYGMKWEWSFNNLEHQKAMATQGVDNWCEERDFYSYGSNSCAWGKVCGHYTQVVWETSRLIGCGMTECKPKAYLLSCVYMEGGNMRGQKPYGPGGPKPSPPVGGSSGGSSGGSGSGGSGGSGSGSSGGSGGGVLSQGKKDAILRELMLAKHNTCRASVGVAPVTWDENLANYAQNYANRLRGCSMRHSQQSARSNIPGWTGKYAGENLAYGMRWTWDFNNIDDLKAMVIQGIDGWCDEKKDYNYAYNSCSSVCGHYTQMVWETTTKIGCGISNCKPKAYMLTCIYQAGGNMRGMKPYGPGGPGKPKGEEVEPEGSSGGDTWEEGSETDTSTWTGSETEEEEPQPGGAIDGAVKDEIIAQHDKCRAADGLGGVKWDTNLENFGTEWAKKLAGEGCGLTHSSGDQRKGISGWEGKYAGENLAWGMNSEWDFSNVEDVKTMATQGVVGWCDEKKDYTLESNTCTAGKQCGHYTQVVWESSDTIGCGIADCGDGNAYMLACIYQEGGNIQGEKPFDKDGEDEEGEEEGEGEGEGEGEPEGEGEGEGEEEGEGEDPDEGDEEEPTDGEEPDNGEDEDEDEDEDNGGDEGEGEEEDDEEDSEVVVDLGNCGGGKNVELRAFSPEGAKKGWKDAEAACKKAGGSLLQLKNKKKQKKFMKKVKSKKFRKAAGCGKKAENSHKMCRPWIGAKVEGGKPVWNDGSDLYKSWRKFPAMNKDWKDGNGLHMVAVGKRPYFHDADDSWTRTSFLCETE